MKDDEHPDQEPGGGQHKHKRERQGHALREEHGYEKRQVRHGRGREINEAPPEPWLRIAVEHASPRADGTAVDNG